MIMFYSFGLHPTTSNTEYDVNWFSMGYDLECHL